MKKTLGIKIILFSALLSSCGQAEFSNTNPLSSFESVEATNSEIEQVLEQVDQDIGNQSTTPELIKEVLSLSPTEAIETYLCQDSKKTEETENRSQSVSGGFVRVGDGSFLKDSNGKNVRAGLEENHSSSSISLSETLNPKYMVCHEKRNSKAKTFCVTSDQLYIFQREISLGLSKGHMGPCR